MAQPTSAVIERLLTESGAGFELDPPQRLARGDRWSWQQLAHALLFANLRVEQRDQRGALRYLEGLFGPELDFDLDRLEPLACDALAELFNVWGVALRRENRLPEAQAMFDAALRCSADAQLNQHALFNRGHTHARIALDLLTDHRSHDEIGVEVRIERALADLKRATRLDAADATAWAWMGLVSLVRASVTDLPVRRRLRDYRRAVAAYQAGLEHERDAEERAIMESNLALALASLSKLESLGWFAKRFGRSPLGDCIEWSGSTRDSRASLPSSVEPFPIAPGSAAALVSPAPGCGVWVHAGQRAVLCVLAGTSPPPPPGRSTPVAILDLSEGTVDAALCSAIATSFGLGDAEVIRLHELGSAAAASALNRCGWPVLARRIPRSEHALQLVRDDVCEHVLVGTQLGVDEIVATRVSYAHIVGTIASASLSAAAIDNALTRLVPDNARFWTTKDGAEQALLVVAGLVGLQVTVID